MACQICALKTYRTQKNIKICGNIFPQNSSENVGI
nr:MAG TPA: hypothetical protein [Caudoviricetes sp.]